MATTSFRKGSKVSWNWGANTATGRIVERFTQPVERTIKGTAVKRNASQREPAYLSRRTATRCSRARAN
ncbi:DUF2945 domain-containing protein [Devosia albogilva]|uniref:DUF2945 domain-containing protein n=1 Tax=Devosia albogilva TaxID=429726 RepID=A0ABW5QLB2_9HYPH